MGLSFFSPQRSLFAAHQGSIIARVTLKVGLFSLEHLYMFKEVSVWILILRSAIHWVHSSCPSLLSFCLTFNIKCHPSVSLFWMAQSIPASYFWNLLSMCASWGGGWEPEVGRAPSCPLTAPSCPLTVWGTGLSLGGLVPLCLTAGFGWPHMERGRSCFPLESRTWHRVSAYTHILCGMNGFSLPGSKPGDQFP